MIRIPLNDKWKFSGNFSDEMISRSFNDASFEDVRIPHTVAETPFDYFDESVYAGVSCYRRSIPYDESFDGKRVFVRFDAVAHEAEVYFNGTLIAGHHCGYTAFEAEVTELLDKEGENILAVRVSSTEEENIPPFGNVIDYMTYGGIYREVSLLIRNENYISDAFVRCAIPEESFRGEAAGSAKDAASVRSESAKATAGDRSYSEKATVPAAISVDITTAGYDEGSSVVVSIADRDGRAVLSETFEAEGERVSVRLPGVRIVPWDVDEPYLYTVEIKLMCNGTEVDSFRTETGFRSAVFKKDGFYLNGRKFKIRGLNRHQSYAYVGYAMPSSMQRFDARILKDELRVNAVRTSHYPQAHSFIEECDRLGLLVFTEFPGWQHIGDEDWKKQAIVNLREMITEYKNHPSIILWGVRINESKDDDAFYEETNRLAHSLDDTRPTGGVRAHAKSSLLEDVYTYNDFTHSGGNAGCAKKDSITSDKNAPYLVTEYNGHMFPTKTFDTEKHRAEHALRHAKVLSDIALNPDICGSFGWCMFDYNTHKDFGSGDRICYHGVMDMFRNPKLASLIYASQSDKDDILEISSSMDIGEQNESVRGEVYIITNADSVRFYKNDVFIKEYFPKNPEYEGLVSPPILIDDYIGDEIVRDGKFSASQAARIKDILNATARYGMSHLPKSALLKGLSLMLTARLGFTDAVELYNRYIGNWGGKSTTFRFEAVRDGQVVKTVVKSPATGLRIEAKASHTELREGETYDVAAVRIRAVDQNGNLLPFAADPVTFTAEGAIEIIGPHTVPLRGGYAGTYVKTTGETGTGTLRISCRGEDLPEVIFTVS